MVDLDSICFPLSGSLVHIVQKPTVVLICLQCPGFHYMSFPLHLLVLSPHQEFQLDKRYTSKYYKKVQKKERKAPPPKNNFLQS